LLTVTWPMSKWRNCYMIELNAGNHAVTLN